MTVPSQLHKSLTEAFDDLWGNFIDPEEPFHDVDGSRWGRIGGGDAAFGLGLPLSEVQLAEIRLHCRMLAATNEFAINGHENRVSYVVGSGHAYLAAASKGRSANAALVGEVQTWLDDFVRTNRWHHRQQEILRRKDRDGECFLRLFPAADGILRVRFVEPDQVKTPPEYAADPAARMGIQTDPADVETVLAYWIDGRMVDAQVIQHRKANVDANVRRGLPLFYAVRKNLRRAEKLLRNMSAVAQIQSAIALIRKHQSAGAAIDQFVRNQTTVASPSQPAGVQRYAPGTILDASAGIDYQFPAAALDAARYVTVLQAELRAVASRLVMPEFMLTSDASNANYSSTMVAEGPAVKMFQRLQQEMIEDDLALLDRAVSHAVAVGRLPVESIGSVAIRAIAPTVAVQDRLRDAQADQILVRNGAMSAATMAMRHGLDPQEEEVGQ